MKKLSLNEIKISSFKTTEQGKNVVGGAMVPNTYQNQNCDIWNEYSLVPDCN